VVNEGTPAGRVDGETQEALSATDPTQAKSEMGHEEPFPARGLSGREGVVSRPRHCRCPNAKTPPWQGCRSFRDLPGSSGLLAPNAELGRRVLSLGLPAQDNGIDIAMLVEVLPMLWDTRFPQNSDLSRDVKGVSIGGLGGNE
jgi:hypothetical protein